MITTQVSGGFMQIFQSGLKVFLLIGMAFWLAGSLPVEEE